MFEPSFRHPLAQVAATVLLFLGTLWLNERLFQRLEFVPGIHWVYLPAGVRLLCVLLFAEAGAVGLLLASWYAGGTWLFPHDPTRAFIGGLMGAVAPYAVYRGARHAWGWGTTLRELTPHRLLLLALGCAVANPLLHHLWFAAQGQPDLLRGFFAMGVGDFAGTLLVLYALRAMLLLVPRHAG